jgi:uncharacterized protein
MSTPRGYFSPLLALLLLATCALGGGAQSATPAASDDRARCETGEIEACVRAETARCEAGEAKACQALIRRYMNGVAVPRDRPRAEQMMARTARLADSACTAGDLGGCAIAGVAYGLGQGVPRDLARARALEERACDGGSAEGCFTIGFASLYGMAGFERDTARAAQVLESTCAGGHSNACFQLGWNYEFGRTVARDFARAALFYDQACENASTADDMMGCHFLGSAYADGRGVAVDAARAAQLYERACRAGNGHGCNNLGQLIQEGRVRGGRNPGRASLIYGRACKLGNPSGCNNLGMLYARGYGVEQDEDRAKQLFRQACEMALRPACRD